MFVVVICLCCKDTKLLGIPCSHGKEDNGRVSSQPWLRLRGISNALSARISSSSTDNLGHNCVSHSHCNKIVLVAITILPIAMAVVSFITTVAIAMMVVG